MSFLGAFCDAFYVVSGRIEACDTHRPIADAQVRLDVPALKKHGASTHLAGRKRIALQTSSIATWRTPWIPCFCRCFQRTSLLRSVASCPDFG